MKKTTRTHFITLTFITLALNTFTACQSQGITEEERQWLVNKTKEDLVFVEGGTFMMGDVGYTDENGQHQMFSGDTDCLPVHQVTLDSYSIQKYEVTFQELDLYFKDLGKEILRPDWRNEAYAQPNMAAQWTNWYQAQDYCVWLGEQVGIPMSLPTEAQWEYAARNRGQAVAHATDNGKIEGNRNYWGGDYPEYGTPPGTFPPNPLGIYDMSGNRPEWTYDWDYNYPREAQVNPKQEENTYVKIVRGYHDLYGSAYRRGKRDPDKSYSIGIRCVVNSPKPVKNEQMTVNGEK